ncbi:hypothetical protein SARC_10096 [Sphaeroforma arctica JP610]|uniref:RanBP2-type domain-containing protein n=1 Tax=Sphaeroforma arctica JP610 TaxID=667725 RepID=A0A0L0FKY1_9EUKA|nr:hypothetical protein SARC_10096 [Sphaeroforma arctica JP610]KNC77444.1 hypothetical protein SARC_10096 [Sphaeroforma arctica JP610]|eukprot:XP_014151346.1 hypothetical protein SARC_10096 [Sphaeroforma arctica JP610]
MGRPPDEPGSWICSDSACGNINFARRTECNKCNTKKPADATVSTSKHSIGEKFAKGTKGLFSSADWQCPMCSNINWSKRATCNVCNHTRDGKTEDRGGLGGGFNEREGIEYHERVETDDEFDEFGRRKKKKSKTMSKSTTTAQLEVDEEDGKEELDKYDLEEDEEDEGDASKYDLGASDDDDGDEDMSNYELEIPEAKTIATSIKAVAGALIATVPNASLEMRCLGAGEVLETTTGKVHAESETKALHAEIGMMIASGEMEIETEAVHEEIETGIDVAAGLEIGVVELLRTGETASADILLREDAVGLQIETGGRMTGRGTVAVAEAAAEAEAGIEIGIGGEREITRVIETFVTKGNLLGQA